MKEREKGGERRCHLVFHMQCIKLCIYIAFTNRLRGINPHLKKKVIIHSTMPVPGRSDYSIDFEIYI